MVEIKKIDLESNEVTYDDFTTTNHDKFYDLLLKHFNNRIAGETVSPFDIERFMKRTSSKNVSQLLHGKKVEGFLEATTGKKLDANWTKFILIMIVVIVVVCVLILVMKMMHIM
jgi:hypothetical protein